MSPFEEEEWSPVFTTWTPSLISGPAISYSSLYSKSMELLLLGHTFANLVWFWVSKLPGLVLEWRGKHAMH